jgi:hypothetical protein
VLTFASAPDYETKSTYTATVTASDGSYSTTQDITVTINDLYENTNSPVFTSSASFSANENQTAIGTVTATDTDGDTVSFSISGYPGPGAEIAITNLSNSSSGNISFISAPDYETKSSYTANVTASDGSNSTTQEITVTINDINESPEITSSAYSVNEDETAIGTISATDPEGDTITYSISGSEININSSSGVLTFASAPDYETKSTYTATVTASDGTSSKDKNINVYINDINLWTKSSSVIEDCGLMEMSKDGNVLVCKKGTKAKTYFSASGGSGWSSGNIDDGDTSRSFDGTFFSAVDLNDDGSTLAISSTIHSGGVNYQTGPGAVWIYSRNGNNWTQKNNTNDPTGGSYNNAGVSGVANGDYFGHSVSLSSDGNRIAVGAPFADGDGLANNGSISIWDWTEITGAGDDRTEWVQVGSTKYGHINGSGDGLGHSIALSKDGNVIISGAPNREYARVFRWDGSDWNAEATFNVDINSSDCFGGDVDIDADGDTVIVSANGCDGENDRGYVNVYRKSSSNNTWAQLGSSILGEYDDDGSGFQADEFGHAVSISDDGSVVAISSRKNPGSLDISSQYKNAGHVRVFEYSNGAWKQLDNDLDGAVEDARFGDDISLSDDGKKITISSSEDRKIYTYTRN